MKIHLSSNRTRIFFLCIGIGALGCIVYGYLRFWDPCNELQCIVFPLVKNSTQTEVYEKTDRSYLALYTLPDILVRVEKRSKLSQEDANTLTKITVMRMQGQFETARSPYPGILSDAITCDPKFDIKPVNVSNNNLPILFFTGFVNNRKQYGSCIDEEIQYTGLNSIFYCTKQKSWYRIEALIPKAAEADTASYTQQLQRIACQ